MWRFKQQKNEQGEKLNMYHVEENDTIIGVFVFMNVDRTEAENLDAIMELYTDDEMDEEWAQGHQEAVREGALPQAPPPPEEASPPLPLEETPLRVV